MIAMGLNIKSEEVHELARQVADLTGASMTTAVETALRGKRSSIERENEREAVFARVKRILKESGPTPRGVTSDHSDLYDDAGLPA